MKGVGVRTASNLAIEAGSDISAGARSPGAKGALGEVELAGGLLHLAVGEPERIGEDGELAAAEAGGETPEGSSRKGLTSITV